MDKNTLRIWYGRGLSEEQLDGTGALSGSIYETINYVSLGILTQAEADAIKESRAQ